MVGLAGPYCAGKNSLLPFFRQLGYEILDLDQLGHLALEHEKQQVVHHFGKHILTPENSINRKILGALVFSSRERLKLLESLIHPRMRTDVIHALSQRPEVRYVINAAILFRLGLDRLCDVIVWVDAPWFMRLIRGLNRDHLGLLKTLPRVFANRQKLKLNNSKADILRVRNLGGLEHTLQALREQWELHYGKQ